MPGPSSVTVTSTDSPPAAARRHRDPAAGVPDRVVDQVDQHPPQCLRVAGHRARAGRPRHTGTRPRVLRSAIPATSAARSTGRPGAALAAALLQPGQHQQVLGQPGQPHRVGQHIPGGLLPLLAAPGGRAPPRAGPGCSRSGCAARARCPRPTAAAAAGRRPAGTACRSASRRGCAPRPGPRAPAVPAGRPVAVTCCGSAAQRGDGPQRGADDQPAGPVISSNSSGVPTSRARAHAWSACRAPGVVRRGGDDRFAAVGRDRHHPQHVRHARKAARRADTGARCGPRVAVWAGGSSGTSRSAPGRGGHDPAAGRRAPGR